MANLHGLGPSIVNNLLVQLLFIQFYVIGVLSFERHAQLLIRLIDRLRQLLKLLGLSELAVFVKLAVK